MSLIKIKNYESANIVGIKIVDSRSVREGRITERINGVSHEFYEVTFFLKISSSPGEFIRVKPDVYLKAARIKIRGPFNTTPVEILSSNFTEYSFRLDIEKVDGTSISTLGDVNSYNIFPVVSIMGYLYFKIPILSDEDIGSMELAFRNEF